jgi:hypothetical protein
MKNYFIFNNKEFQDLGTQSSQRRRQKIYFGGGDLIAFVGLLFAINCL